MHCRCISYALSAAYAKGPMAWLGKFAYVLYHERHPFDVEMVRAMSSYNNLISLI